MAYGTPADPVGGTVITVAYAVANLLDPIRWLRLMTGNADPPGSSYVVVSESTTGTTWRKVPMDAIVTLTMVDSTTPSSDSGSIETLLNGLANQLRNAKGTVSWRTSQAISLASLDADKADLAGDTFTGAVSGTSFAASGNVTAGGVVNASGSMSVGTNLTVSGNGAISGTLGVTGAATVGSITGGSTSTGNLSVATLATGAGGIAAGAISASSLTVSGGASITSALSAGSYGGGTTAAGTPSFKGLNVGADGAVIGAGGITTTGPMNPANYAGGSTSTGTPSVKGLLVGSDGIASTGTITIGGSEVYHPSNPPPLGSGAAVPSGLVAMFRTAAAIASGWSRETDLDGRIPVGAGTTFSTTFTEATNYGSSWSHAHTDGGVHNHSGSSLGVSGVTGAAQGGTAYDEDDTGNGFNTRDASHTHDQGTLDVSGNTANNSTTATSSDAWVIPSRAYVFAIKT